MPDVSVIDELESEAIFIIRELASHTLRPALLFSGGKDSAVLLHIAEKAFYPLPLPFPVLHVDTGRNFPEILEFRDVRTREHELVISSLPDLIASGHITDSQGSRNKLQSVALLHTLQEYGFNACLGGARRDEDKSRAKERIFSFRDRLGQWNPRQQRPEPWKLYNPHIRPGESIRCFPLSNWTEINIWQYIERENITLPSIYFSHERQVFMRDGMFLPVCPYLELRANETIITQQIRYRTVGDMDITGAVASPARTISDILAELLTSDYSECGQTRADDKLSPTAMEERKREGYF